MKMKRIILLSICIIIILCAGVFLIKNKDLFKAEISITYKDGCTETYLGDELTSEKCPQINSSNDLNINEDMSWLIPNLE